MIADESVADRREVRRRSARCAVALGLSMGRRRTARTVSPTARTEVVGLEEVELALGGRRWRLSRPCRQADVVKDESNDRAEDGDVLLRGYLGRKHSAPKSDDS